MLKVLKVKMRTWVLLKFPRTAEYNIVYILLKKSDLPKMIKKKSNKVLNYVFGLSSLS